MREARVWVLPGLGADSRIFRNLEFPWSATFLEWTLPEVGESLSSYADRLLAPHDIQEHDLLFGYSFGGIVAQDWASRHRCAARCFTQFASVQYATASSF